MVLEGYLAMTIAKYPTNSNVLNPDVALFMARMAPTYSKESAPNVKVENQGSIFSHNFQISNLNKWS
jgi:hypothetical protein